MLAELVEEGDHYRQARERHLSLLEHAADLGTHGDTSWDREALHKR